MRTNLLDLRTGLLVSRLCLTVFFNHAAHLILQMQFLLLDIDFFELILIRHMGTAMKFIQLYIVGSVFLREATETRVIGK